MCSTRDVGTSFKREVRELAGVDKDVDTRTSLKLLSFCDLVSDLPGNMILNLFTHCCRSTRCSVSSKEWV